MKRFLFFLLWLSATCVSAQDVIVKKDGSTIISKVIEIGTTEVKYKKFSNQDGPTYSILKSEIRAINYKNGEKETFSELNHSAPTPQPSYNSNYNSQVAEGIIAGNRLQKEKLLASAKSWDTVGNVWYWACFISGVVGGFLVYDDENQTPAYIAVGGGIASGFIGLGICRAISNNKEKAANSIASIPIIKQDINLGNSRLSAGINIMKDQVKQKHTFGVGLSISL